MAHDTTPRRRLIEALHADLVGPFYPEGYEGSREEVLHLPPSRWYLTGFLAPQGGAGYEGRDLGGGARGRAGRG